MILTERLVPCFLSLVPYFYTAKLSPHPQVRLALGLLK
jgi:hypothetical protein